MPATLVLLPPLVDVSISAQVISPPSTAPNSDVEGWGRSLLRRIIVGCLSYVLGPLAEDFDLRRHGPKLTERGGKKPRNGRDADPFEESADVNDMATVSEQE